MFRPFTIFLPNLSIFLTLNLNLISLTSLFICFKIPKQKTNRKHTSSTETQTLIMEMQIFSPTPHNLKIYRKAEENEKESQR
jgi:hypothetical protein